MDFAKTMVRHLNKLPLPDRVYFTFRHSSYRITSVHDNAVHYLTADGNVFSVHVTTIDMYNIKSVKIRGSKLVRGSARVDIDIGRVGE